MPVRLFIPEFSGIRVIRCSPPSWMAQLALAEKGVHAEYVVLDFNKGEHKTPEMLARNPRGTIPVLEHDGACVHETLAILQYIDQQLPGPPITPEAHRARTLTWLHETAYVKNRGMDLFAYLMRHPPDGRDPSEVTRMTQAFAGELTIWDGRLPEPGSAPDEPLSTLGLAGLCLFTYAETARWLGFAFDALPRLAHFCATMAKRASARASWPQAWRQADGERPLAAAQPAGEGSAG